MALPWKAPNARSSLVMLQGQAAQEGKAGRRKNQRGRKGGEIQEAENYNWKGGIKVQVTAQSSATL